MDRVDEKILVELIDNSRQTISQIAKQVQVSRDVAQYRLQQLVKKGIISDFITKINHMNLGYISALFFVSIKVEKEEEFIEFVSGLDFVSWAGTHMGFWSLGMAIYGKNVAEIEERFQSIFLKYKDYISNHQFYIYKTTEFYTSNYFGIQKQTENIDQKKYSEHKVDEYDKIILKELSMNSRKTCVEISQKIPISAVAIAKRISKLEKSGYIEGYTIALNVLKLNLYLFIFFMKNKNLEQRKKLFSYLQKHPKVSLLLDYVGDPFIEFGIFVKNPYETRAIIQEIKETFPDNELADFFLTQEDFLSYGAPRCVFE